MKVIAVSGWKRSGKDTVAEYLIENHSAFRTAFADPLKNMVSKEYDIPLEYVYDQKLKESPILQYPVIVTDKFIRGYCKLLKDEFRKANGKKPKKMVTAEGKSWLKSFGVVVEANTMEPVYWTPRALCIAKGSGNRSVDGYYWNNRTAKEAKESDSALVVIPDLRFKTEAEFLKKTFPDLLLIRINRFTDVDSNDPSERDLDDYTGFDHIIDNKGTLEELYAKIEAIL